MKRILVVWLALLTLSSMGCASSSVANAGCDFVSGAHGNEQRREQSQTIGGSSAQNNRDTEVGIINAILGVFTRQINDDEECL